jgi:hypothetical protein
MALRLAQVWRFTLCCCCFFFSISLCVITVAYFCVCSPKTKVLVKHHFRVRIYMCEGDTLTLKNTILSSPFSINSSRRCKNKRAVLQCVAVVEGSNSKKVKLDPPGQVQLVPMLPPAGPGIIEQGMGISPSFAEQLRQMGCGAAGPGTVAQVQSAAQAQSPAQTQSAAQPQSKQSPCLLLQHQTHTQTQQQLAPHKQLEMLLQSQTSETQQQVRNLLQAQIRNQLKLQMLSQVNGGGGVTQQDNEDKQQAGDKTGAVAGSPLATISKLAAASAAEQSAIIQISASVAASSICSSSVETQNKNVDIAGKAGAGSSSGISVPVHVATAPVGSSIGSGNGSEV